MSDADWVSRVISRRFLAAESESGSEIFLSHLVFEKIEGKGAKKRVFGNFWQSISDEPDVLENSTIAQNKDQTIYFRISKPII